MSPLSSQRSDVVEQPWTAKRSLPVVLCPLLKYMRFLVSPEGQWPVLLEHNPSGNGHVLCPLGPVWNTGGLCAA